jgi:hypothetical protein
VKSDFVRFYFVSRAAAPNELRFFKAQRRLLIGTDALTRNKPLLYAARTL